MKISIPNKINALLKFLHYPVDEDGICEGIVMMAGIAFLTSLNRKKPFTYWLDLMQAVDARYEEQFARLGKNYNTKDKKEAQKLFTIATKSIVKALRENLEGLNKRTKIKPNINYQIEELKLFDLYALFDGIALHLSPYDYRDVFEAPIQQGQSEKITPLTLSFSSEKAGDHSNYLSWCDHVDEAHLQDSITQIFNEFATHQKDFVVYLQSYDHTIGLAFNNATKDFALLIPSMLNDSDALYTKKSLQEITKILMQELLNKDTHDVALNLKIQFLSNDPELTKAIITSVKQNIIPNEQRILAIAASETKLDQLLKIAAQNDNASIISIVQSHIHYDWHKIVDDGDSVMDLFCYYNAINCIKALPLRILQTPDAKKNYPVHSAAKKDAYQILRYFNECRFDFNVLNNRQANPLITAIYYEKKAAIQYLLSLDTTLIGINQVYDNLHTPLYYALETNDLKLMRQLIRRGANAIIELKDGKTVAHAAARKNDIELLKQLPPALLHKANVKGELPIDVAIKKNNFACIDWLWLNTPINIKDPCQGHSEKRMLTADRFFSTTNKKQKLVDKAPAQKRRP